MEEIGDGGSVEYQTLKSSEDTLYRGFQNSPSLCKNFHEKKLISYDVLSTYSGKFEENERHAKNVVDVLVNRVKDDRSAFPAILEVLRTEKSLEYLAKILEDKKKELEICSRTTHQAKKRPSSAASPQDSGTRKVLPPSTVPTASKSTSRMAPKMSPEGLPKAKADKPTSGASSRQQTPGPIQQVTLSQGPAMLHGSKPLKMEDSFCDEHEQNNAEECQPSSKCNDSSLNDDTYPEKLLSQQRTTQCCQNCPFKSSNMIKQLDSLKKEKEAALEDSRKVKEDQRKVNEEYDRKVQELRDEVNELKEDRRDLREEIKKLKREHSCEMQDKKTEIKQLKDEHTGVVKALKDEIGQLKCGQEERMRFQAPDVLQYLDPSAIASIASWKGTIFEPCEVTSQNKGCIDDKIIESGDTKPDEPD